MGPEDGADMCERAAPCKSDRLALCGSFATGVVGWGGDACPLPDPPPLKQGRGLRFPLLRSGGGKGPAAKPWEGWGQPAPKPQRFLPWIGSGSGAGWPMPIIALMSAPFSRNWPVSVTSIL